ncbi:MAG: metal-sensitive transcriptional regulator [Clostridia bacterium]|nr:metal-sensitive transcriptional regulator [Clostridia bacterium]
MVNVSDNYDKQMIINRLKRIEGQVKGVQRMIKDDKCCSDILIQIAAIRSATNKVGGLILKNHAIECIKETVNCEENDDKIDELIDILLMYIK